MTMMLEVVARQMIRIATRETTNPFIRATFIFSPYFHFNKSNTDEPQSREESNDFCDSTWSHSKDIFPKSTTLDKINHYFLLSIISHINQKDQILALKLIVFQERSQL